MLTPDQIAARTARAVAAATAAGRELGLWVAEPRVLYDVFSVIVHLAPAPVVVRVPTVLPSSHSADPEKQTAQQCAEISVTGWLADRGCPVVAPSPLVPRAPVHRDGFSMTFWQYVEEVPDVDPDVTHRFEMTARLHAALREYDDTDLSFCTPFNTYIPDGLAELERRPDLLSATDRERAQREWSLISPLIASPEAFESAFPDAGIQPIHGDAPFHNMITTADGALWSDFELVTLGPIESDIATTAPESVAAYGAAAEQLGLRPVDRQVLPSPRRPANSRRSPAWPWRPSCRCWSKRSSRWWTSGEPRRHGWLRGRLGGGSVSVNPGPNLARTCRKSQCGKSTRPLA